MSWSRGRVVTLAGLVLLVLQGSCSTSTPTGGTSNPTLSAVTVTPSGPTIAQGATQQFKATGTYSDNSTEDLTTSVTWSSSPSTVATISNNVGSNGLATSVGPGKATIQAALNGISGSTMLTVSSTLTSLSVTPANPTITQGATEQFKATGTYSDNSTQDLTSAVTWSSSPSTVATISNTVGRNGLAASVGPGKATIQAALNGISGSTMLTVSSTLTSLSVTPANPTITKGAIEHFKATGTYSDNSTQDLTTSVTWSSSSSTVATISNTAGSNGLATGTGIGSTTIEAKLNPVEGSITLTVVAASSGQVNVTTWHNDNGRTGQNTKETILTPLNVNVNQFGKLFALAVDGQVYAQPLYVAGLAIPGKGTHNVVFAATENDSVYAFDADSNATYLWKASLVDTAHGAPSGATPVNVNDVGCAPGSITPSMGITSTPVIDTNTNTMYVVVFSEESGKFVNRLHAIDITTGSEKSPGPVVIDATVGGTGDGSSSGQLTFSQQLSQLIRPGLLLSNSMIYVAAGANCEDVSPFHGWLFAYNESTLAQKAVLVTTPNGGDGGIWMSGAGLAADSSGNVYGVTGNGTFDTTNVPATELGDTILKLGANLSLLDYFTPWDQLNMDTGDNDLGSGGVLLLPTQSGSYPDLLIQSGKLGAIYLVNRDQMTTGPNGGSHYCSTCTSIDTEIVQELPNGTIGGMWSSPAYWNNTVYFWGQYDSLKAYSLTNGLLSTTPTSMASAPGTYFGQTPSVSSNGTANGIVWAIPFASGGAGEAILLAYDATNLSTELYSSEQAPNNRDIPGAWAKFSVPVITNGKVYIGTNTEVDVYGLLP